MRKVKAAIFLAIAMCFVISKYGNKEAVEEIQNKIDNIFESEFDVNSNAKAASKKEPGTIVEVIDGDTYIIKIDNKDKTVRLIGVDTPESVSNNSKYPNVKYGKKVSNYVKSILPVGSKVKLEYDEDKHDDFDRVLAYVYAKNEKGDSFMINKHLVKKGYARATYYSPNDKYRNSLKKLHLKAKKKCIGFWKDGKTPDKAFEKTFPNRTEYTY